jgi:transcriptional regulator with XRE-family HTH domain
VEGELDDLGPRLRELRRSRRLTLEAVAGDTGLTVSYLSQIENGAATPSLTALGLIAAGLGADLATFFPDGAAEESRVIRAGDPDRFRIAPNSREEYALLAGRVHGGDFTALLARHFPGAPVLRYRHGGEEYALVLEGALRFDVDGDVHTVDAGGWIHYASHPAHSAEVVSNRPAEVLWLLSPAIF